MKLTYEERMKVPVVTRNMIIDDNIDQILHTPMLINLDV